MGGVAVLAIFGASISAKLGKKSAEGPPPTMNERGATTDGGSTGVKGNRTLIVLGSLEAIGSIISAAGGGGLPASPQVKSLGYSMEINVAVRGVDFCACPLGVARIDDPVCECTVGQAR